MRRMMTPDLNVLLAASRSDHPHHKPALAWMNQAIARCDIGGSIELLPMVAVGFLRLATNSKIFVEPMPIAAAACLALGHAYMLDHRYADAATNYSQAKRAGEALD